MTGQAGQDGAGFLTEQLSEDAGYFYRAGRLLEKGRSAWLPRQHRLSPSYCNPPKGSALPA